MHNLMLATSLTLPRLGGRPRPRAWSPVTGLSDADILLDATQSVTESAGAVSLWSSLVGETEAAQATATRQPTLTTDGSVTWIDFDGVYDWLDTDVINGATREVHMAVRVSGANNATNQMLYGAMSSDVSESGTDRRSFMCLSPDGYLSMSIGTMSGGDWTPHAVDLFDTDLVLGFSHDAAGNLALYVDGAEVGTDTNVGASTPINPSRVANLGNASWDGFHTAGRIYGLCDMPRLLTSSERGNLASWLAAKQGRTL